MGRGFRDLRLDGLMGSAPASSMYGGGLSLPQSLFGHFSLPPTRFGQFSMPQSPALHTTPYRSGCSPRNGHFMPMAVPSMPSYMAGEPGSAAAAAAQKLTGGMPMPGSRLRINTGKPAAGGQHRPKYSIRAEASPHVLAPPAPLADLSNLAAHQPVLSPLGAFAFGAPQQLQLGAGFSGTSVRAHALALDPRLDPAAPAFDPSMQSTLDFCSLPGNEQPAVGSAVKVLEAKPSGSGGASTNGSNRSHGSSGSALASAEARSIQSSDAHASPNALERQVTNTLSKGR